MTLEEALAELARVREDNSRLRAENEALQALVKSLQERQTVLEREQKRQAAPFRRRPDLKVKDKDRKQPGRKPGHPGDYRRVPAKIDETVCVALDCCPKCRGPVELGQMVTQYIEELPPIKPIVTRLVTWIGQCVNCGKVESEHPLQTSRAQGVAGTQLGPRAQALAVLLNKHYHLPLRQACGVLKEGFGLSLSAGGLSQLITRVARKLQGKYEELIDRIRASDAVYADETGWWVGGPGYWLWVFTTPTSTVYRIASSRGHPVAAKVLGDDFGGVLVSDCAPVYDKFNCPQHKCIAHHLQAIKRQQDKLAKRDDPSYLESWKQFWNEVLELAAKREQLPAEEFAARRAQFEERADELLRDEPTAKGDHSVWVRMRNARKHLLGCLWHQVDATNNRAERAIRPAVVARKISCGNRTEQGARATEILTSLITTARQQARDFLAELTQSLAITAQPAG
jgi:transposase